MLPNDVNNVILFGVIDEEPQIYDSDGGLDEGAESRVYLRVVVDGSPHEVSLHVDRKHKSDFKIGSQIFLIGSLHTQVYVEEDGIEHIVASVDTTDFTVMPS